MATWAVTAQPAKMQDPLVPRLSSQDDHRMQGGQKLKICCSGPWMLLEPSRWQHRSLLRQSLKCPILYLSWLSSRYQTAYRSRNPSLSKCFFGITWSSLVNWLETCEVLSFHTLCVVASSWRHFSLTMSCFALTKSVCGSVTWFSISAAIWPSQLG